MAAPTDDFDDIAPLARLGVGVRESLTMRETYELAVIGFDVADVVSSAGGWICDRGRAGWRVKVLVPAGSDTRPLQILGVEALQFERDYETVRASSPAALAVGLSVFATDERVKRDVREAVSRRVTEVTLWGELSPTDFDLSIDDVQHRLSSVARAFKTQALIAAFDSGRRAESVEEFRSAAMWYPRNGSDLTPMH